MARTSRAMTCLVFVGVATSVNPAAGRYFPLHATGRPDAPFGGARSDQYGYGGREGDKFILKVNSNAVGYPMLAIRPMMPDAARFPAAPSHMFRMD
jgi:hypothetical protein